MTRPAPHSRRGFLIGGVAATAALATSLPAQADVITPKRTPRAQHVPQRVLKETTSATQAAVDRRAAQERADGNVVVDIDFEYQQTSYWCGPAATRIALSARGVAVTQQQMANELPTSEAGTDWIGQVTRVMSSYVGWYETKEMPDDPPTQAQSDLLWSDITYDLDRGYALVTNIVAPPGNHPPGYPDTTIWHYFTVIGYNAASSEVLIADPAGFNPEPSYWLTFDQLASLIPPKGYSA